MELKFFAQFFSKNPDEATNAMNLVLEATKDPSYIQLLFQFLQSPESQANLEIERAIHLTILQIIRSYWNSFNDQSESSNENIYWNQEQQAQVTNQLFNILFSIPYSRRINIVECFRHIIMKPFPNNYNIIETFIQLFDAHSSSIEDITTLSNITFFWTKACNITVIPNEIIERIELLSLEIINRFTTISLQAEAPQSFLLLRFVSKCLKNLIKKRDSPLKCQNLDNFLSVLIKSLTITAENQDSNNLYLLKRSILSFFISLCTTFFPKDSSISEIHSQYSLHYKQNIAPVLLQSLIQCISNERDQYILSSIIYLFDLFLHFDVGDRLFLNTEFITHLIIPVARLTPQDIEESETNPLQYLEFNLTYENSPGIRTTRTTTASLIGEILKDDRYIDDLYDFLLAPTVNQIDFEGRIFLMTKFLKATNSNMGPMIDEGIVNVLVEQTKNVTSLPPFLITSLLMFMSSVLPFMDPEIGCQLASQCILQSDSQIVNCAASELLRASIVECEQRVQLPITEIIPKLLNLASMVKYENISKCVEALIQIGGKAITPYIKDTVTGLLALCNQSLADEEMSKDVSSSLYSLFEIINSIPDDAPILVELSEVVLPACVQFFTNYPNNNCFDDIFLLISDFNTKIDNVTDTMIQTYIQTIQIIRKDIDVFVSSMKSIAYIMCPIIANPGFKGNSTMIASTVDILMHLLKSSIEYGDKDVLAYVILIIATLIQSIQESGFAFIPHICNALSNVDDKSATCLFSACVFALASALIVNAEKSLSMIPKEVIEFILPRISQATCQTYKELKMGFIFLLKASQFGFVDSYVLAVNILQPLCERKIENNMDLEDKMNTAEDLIHRYEDDAEFPPLIIPFNLPSDQVDEYHLFGEISQAPGMFQKLSAEQQAIVNQIFH